MTTAIYPPTDRLQTLLLSEPAAKPRSKDYWPGVALAAAAVFLAVTKLAGWWPA